MGIIVGALATANDVLNSQVVQVHGSHQDWTEEVKHPHLRCKEFVRVWEYSIRIGRTYYKKMGNLQKVVHNTWRCGSIVFYTHSSKGIRLHVRIYFLRKGARPFHVYGTHVRAKRQWILTCVSVQFPVASFSLVGSTSNVIRHEAAPFLLWCLNKFVLQAASGFTIRLF